MKKPTASGRRKSTKPTKSPAKATPAKRSSSQLSANTSTSRNTSQNATMDVSRRTRRFKNGTKAIREIKALQRTTKLLIPKACFCRLVKEIMNQFSYYQLRIQSAALQALQEAAEMYMVQLFEDSLLCCVHAKRVTLMIQDCHLVRRLRGPAEICNRSS